VGIERAPEIEELLRNTYAAHQRGEPGFTDLVSRDPAASSYGSDPTQDKGDREAFLEMLRVDLAGRADAPPKAALRDVVAYRDGDFGWAVAHIAFPHPNGSGDVPFRATVVLRREDGEWKIVQWTVAVLIPDETLLAAWPFEPALSAP
jgi:hypothetical protein